MHDHHVRTQNEKELQGPQQNFLNVTFEISTVLLKTQHFIRGIPSSAEFSCCLSIYVTWLLSLAAFLAISMSGRPSMLSPWLPSLRCLALYSTWIKGNQSDWHICKECLVLIMGSGFGRWGYILTTLFLYLTGLFGCLRGLLNVWPVSHCGVM